MTRFQKIRNPRDFKFDVLAPPNAGGDGATRRFKPSPFLGARAQATANITAAQENIRARRSIVFSVPLRRRQPNVFERVMDVTASVITNSQLPAWPYHHPGSRLFLPAMILSRSRHREGPAPFAPNMSFAARSCV